MALLQGVWTVWNYVWPFLLLITPLVFFHELGHFSMARLFGVKIETFSIGFGREIAAFTDRSSLGTTELRMWHRRGGQGIQLTQKDEQPDVADPDFSRDGRFLYFSARDARYRYGRNVNEGIWQIKRLDRVTSERGYQGVAVVCAVFFSPIAGHVRDRYAIQYLAQLRDIELWLAPIANTRVMVPFRVAIPTPLGLGVLQATQFVSMPQPSRATARTQ